MILVLVVQGRNTRSVMGSRNHMQGNDAVTIAPEVHRILFEDEKVRVLNVYLPVGRKTEMHWHPNNISYVVSGGKMRILRQDKTVVDVSLAPEIVIPGSEGEHIVENIGSSDIHTIQVEFLRD